MVVVPLSPQHIHSLDPWLLKVSSLLCVLCVLPPAMHANQSSSRQLGRTPKRPAVHHFPRLACPSSAASGSCRSLRRPDWTGEPTMHQASCSKSRCRPAEERRAWHPWLGQDPTPPDLARSCLFFNKSPLSCPHCLGPSPRSNPSIPCSLPGVFALRFRPASTKHIKISASLAWQIVYPTIPRPSFDSCAFESSVF